MNYKDLREFVAFLESKGQLHRIQAPVSCELEMTEIADRMVKSDGPALLFENVTGYDMPVLMNLFCSDRRMAWALGVESVDDLVNRLEDMLRLAQGAARGPDEQTPYSGPGYPHGQLPAQNRQPRPLSGSCAGRPGG